MEPKTQSLAIRLLRPDQTPTTAVRSGVSLKDWPQFPGAKIATGSLGGGPPGWAKFLELDESALTDVMQRSAFGLAFVEVEGRWFALSFGLGHVKLQDDAFEQDFGLRVVLNAVDPRKLRSTDLRTPDENTITRRSQSSKRSGQEAFSIDVERDIVRGVTGEPRDANFASALSGSDALHVRRKLKLTDVPTVCSQALAMFGKSDYQGAFGWIDQVKHVRDGVLIAQLEAALVADLNGLLEGQTELDMHMAYPVIYDPEAARSVVFRGFRATQIFPDLDLSHYLTAMKSKGIDAYDHGFLRAHFVQERDGDGSNGGTSWKVIDCLVYEADLDGNRYVLSGGRWYRVAPGLAAEVKSFFDSVAKIELPPGEAGDNEKTYNARLAAVGELVFLDAKLLKPTGAHTEIEVCDFLSTEGRLIHIKDKSSSSRLSHLFNQGMVSARVLRRDGPFRDRFKKLVAKQANGAAAAAALPGAATIDPSKLTVVFAVLVGSGGAAAPRLPFFSLVSFRQVGRVIRDELGFGLAFAWVKKPKAAGKPLKRKPKAAA